MKKSTRHSKITGDFAEAFFLYWLSKYGYECARLDHTGIDLIARRPESEEVLGISVKCRSRYLAPKIRVSILRSLTLTKLSKPASHSAASPTSPL